MTIFVALHWATALPTYLRGFLTLVLIKENFLMKIEFVEQHAYFIFTVNGEYHRVSFERNEKEADWMVRLIDVTRNETVYSKTLEAIVTPDIQLAEDIVKAYVLR